MCNFLQHPCSPKTLAWIGNHPLVWIIGLLWVALHRASDINRNDSWRSDSDRRRHFTPRHTQRETSPCSRDAAVPPLVSQGRAVWALTRQNNPNRCRWLYCRDGVDVRLGASRLSGAPLTVTASHNDSVQWGHPCGEPIHEQRNAEDRSEIIDGRSQSVHPRAFWYNCTSC